MTQRRSDLQAALDGFMGLAIWLTPILLAGCASLQPQDFAGSTPAFDPQRFFLGPVHSWGVVEDGSGNPRSRFETHSNGRMDGQNLILTQDLAFEDGRKQHRIWQLRPLDAHHYTGTVSDCVGAVTGTAYGKSVVLEYTLALRPGNFLSHVHFKQWMYLQDGGNTMVNRVMVNKFGIAVGRATEYFARDP